MSISQDRSNIRSLSTRPTRAKTATLSLCADDPSSTLNSWCNPGSWQRSITNIKENNMAILSRCLNTSLVWRSLVVPVCWDFLWSRAIVILLYGSIKTAVRCLYSKCRLEACLRHVHVPQLSTLPSLVQHFQRQHFKAPISVICKFNLRFSCCACDMLCFGVLVLCFNRFYKLFIVTNGLSGSTVLIHRYFNANIRPIHICYQLVVRFQCRSLI